jgi:hypothetical protein
MIEATITLRPSGSHNVALTTATGSTGTKPIREPAAVADCSRSGSSEEPEVATATAGAIIGTAAAIIEGTAPMRSEPEEVVDAATGSTGTKPIREPAEVVDAATGSTGTKPIREPEAVADCWRFVSIEETEVATDTAGAIIGANAATGSTGTMPTRESEAEADC